MNKLIAIILLFYPIIANAYVSPGSPEGFVNDFAGVIPPEKEQELEFLLSDYEKKTGNEIAVVMINSFENETPETYAVRLFEEWEIGKKGKDNGALFVSAIQDRKMRIEVGYGLEGMLTDVEANNITDNIIPPYFKSEEYSEGAISAVVAMISAIDADYVISSSIAAQIPPPQNGGGFHIGDYFWFVIFIFMWMGSILARSRSWWLGGVIGAVAGIIIWIAYSIWFWLPILVVFGLFFDWLVSTKYKETFTKGARSGVWPWLFLIGGRPGRRWDRGSKGGFGGFGGGMSGGGGASGNW